MTYAEQVKKAIDTIIDVCAYSNGECKEECKAYRLCHADKPLDLLKV